MKELSDTCSRGHKWEDVAVYYPGRPFERVCSTCRLENTKRWRNKNKEKVLFLEKKYRMENVEKCKAKDKKSYEKHKEARLEADKDYYWNGGGKQKARWRIIKRKYGITREEFNEVFERQGMACAICGKRDFTEWTLNIDHDHETGRLRGILCNNCNIAIGLMKDNVGFLECAIKYLELNKTVDNVK